MSSSLEPNLRNMENIQTEKTRKRTRDPDKHKATQQRVKVQKGLEHTTKSGNIIKAKIFHEQTECGSCKKQCSRKIVVRRQKDIFETFYSLENWSKKRLYLRSLIKSLPQTENLKSVQCIAKKTNHKYYLTNNNGEHEEVCYRFFLNCFQVSSSTLNRVIKSAVTNESASDLRGKYPTRKTSKRDLNVVEKFIRKFPSYYSHYGATKSTKKFLNPNLNILRLYREYQLVCNFKKKIPISKWKFREIFNTKFNLSFKPMKTDTCRKCDKFNAAIESERTHTLKREVLQQQKDNHIQIKDRLAETFNDTVKFVRDVSNNVEMFTFDLQRALELPSISTSEAFYRRQLWVYNLCIYDEKRNKAYMYIWAESIASRGAQEITSCLLKHFENFVPPETTRIILNSDSCGGQNRNIKTTVMLKKCLDSWPHSALTTIEQRFFLSGHSYNSCDRCFGVIERQKKITERIIIPQHWVNIIAQAKKNEPKYTVVEMKKSDFFSSQVLERAITNRKTAKNGEKVNWLNIQRIINHRLSPFDIIIEKYSEPPLPPVHISLRKRGRQYQSTNSFSSFDLLPLYTTSRPIKRKKYDDLMKLLEYIPKEFWPFYQGLKCTDDETEPKRKRSKTLVYSSADEE